MEFNFPFSNEILKVDLFIDFIVAVHLCVFLTVGW